MQQNSFSYSLCVVSLSLLALWQNGSCEGGKKQTMSQQQNRVANGVWGGPNVHIEVTEGGAQIRFACAHGSIEGPVTLDSEGRFNAKGTFTSEGMGPRNEDNPPPSGPAVYTGVVQDKKMTLTVTVEADNNARGTYELTRGQNGSVRRCH
ncbi:MAG: hypothetical protein ACJ74Q_19570 [Pyrinomonadaceae bacterium]